MNEVMFVTVMHEWEEIHGEGTGWELIEVVDGFHPSQVSYISHKHIYTGLRVQKIFIF